MDGVHDLGGMEGFGPVPIAGGDQGFAELPEWEQRVWGLTRSIQNPGVTIDWFRHGVERMRPVDYLSLNYFDKWCATSYMLLIDNGKLTLEDVARGPAADPARGPEVTVEEILETNRGLHRSFAAEPAAPARFAVGDRVRTKPRMHAGHTRLPRYARDRTGEVIACHGGHLLPDRAAKGEHVGEHLVTVVFTARELWGPDADPRDDVTLDLWESYLDPA